MANMIVNISAMDHRSDVELDPFLLLSSTCDATDLVKTSRLNVVKNVKEYFI